MNHLPLNKLDGIAGELTAKLTELGVDWNRKQRIYPDAAPGQEPTGNLTGIIRFVRSVGAGDAAAVESLQVLAATVFGRTASSGYKLPN